MIGEGRRKRRARFRFRYTSQKQRRRPSFWSVGGASPGENIAFKQQGRRIHPHPPLPHSPSHLWDYRCGSRRPTNRSNARSTCIRPTVRLTWPGRDTEHSLLSSQYRTQARRYCREEEDADGADESWFLWQLRPGFLDTLALRLSRDTQLTSKSTRIKLTSLRTEEDMTTMTVDDKIKEAETSRVKNLE
ncbi:hypothetical protein B296_00022467 [Ensete ventricosum]|uniref:Uncharacterized protein n=1 Tax=Ensete ventricosum TaxID=4639 RepID=A0A426YBA2_ENSVE|nr:hypothetical protein B296_00022467 [Ensete ventricosum]